MKMLLNRVYRCIYDSSYYEEIGREAFRSHVATLDDWSYLLHRLSEKQEVYPERNYRLQIWDDNRGWIDHSAANSKYALFSED